MYSSLFKIFKDLKYGFRCHRPRDSLFSWTSGFGNFTGFVNWAFLLLSMGGFRLLLENFIKYGIRVDPYEWFIVITGKNEGGASHPSLVLLIYSIVPVALSLIIEKGLSVEIIAHGPGTLAHVVNILVLVLMPMVVIHIKGSSFSLIGATMVCFIYSVFFLKLWSYVQVNSWCRAHRKAMKSKGGMRRQSLSYSSLNKSHMSLRDKDKKLDNDTKNEDSSDDDDLAAEAALIQYPDNLHLKEIFYFICAPTLCYELNFPRTSRVRKRFLVKRIFEVIIGVHVIMAVLQQYMIPSVKNSLIPFSNMDVTKATERLLKLALAPHNIGPKTKMNLSACAISTAIHGNKVLLVTDPVLCGVDYQFKLGQWWIIGTPIQLIPNHLAWLCFFYIVFHSFLNLVGELIHFADRNFYCDWWNADNIDTFWRTWNMPVHRWAVRHVYIPIVDMGYPKKVASTTVFFISAFFHEYLVSVPLKTFKIWAFTGMMGQIPLSYLSRYIEKKWGPRWGNVIVWASIIMGQPLCIMMYYHDYVITHYGKALMEDWGHV